MLEIYYEAFNNSYYLFSFSCYCFNVYYLISSLKLLYYVTHNGGGTKPIGIFLIKGFNIYLVKAGFVNYV